MLEDDQTGGFVHADISLMPAGSKEGDAFFFDGVCYKKDAESTAARREKIKKYLEDLWE